jgi:hypothetical protein
MCCLSSGHLLQLTGTSPFLTTGLIELNGPDGKSEEVGTLRKKVVLPQVMLVAL